MTEQLRVFIGIAAGLMLAIGLFLGFMPVSVGSDVGCGSSFIPDDTASSLTDAVFADGGLSSSFADDCEGSLDARRIPAVILIVAGTLGSGVWLARSPSGARRGS